MFKAWTPTCIQKPLQHDTQENIQQSGQLTPSAAVLWVFKGGRGAEGVMNICHHFDVSDCEVLLFSELCGGGSWNVLLTAPPR